MEMTDGQTEALYRGVQAGCGKPEGALRDHHRPSGGVGHPADVFITVGWISSGPTAKRRWSGADRSRRRSPRGKPPRHLPLLGKGRPRVLYFNIIEIGGFVHTTSLRKVGGSIMLAVPPAILDLLHLEVGATVGLEVDGERLVVNPNIKPRYTLAELLEASDYSQPQPAEEREWIDSPSVGGELI